MISASIYTVVWNCGKEVVHLYRTVPAKGGWDPGSLSGRKYEGAQYT